MPCRYNPIQAMLDQFSHGIAVSLVRAGLCTIYITRTRDPDQDKAQVLSDINWLTATDDDEFSARMKDDSRFKQDVEMVVEKIKERRNSPRQT